ncbi:MAG: HlyD family efflux transporter periplasmic adaptor subunit [Chthoniobacterales bacterium]|nr:HlyD family efflux transporter periplasmic adaptor subunit [Chthoniobacterales bacterium]
MQETRSGREGCGWLPPAARAAALALLAVAFAGCTEEDPARVQGYIEGEFVYVASPFGGRLEDLAVKRGDQVEKGQLLFVLDETAERAAREEALRRVAQAEAQLADARQGLRPSEIDAIEAQLEQAKASLSLAEVELDRQKKLLASRVTSRREVDMAQTTRDEDRQRVAQLESTLETGKLGARPELVKAAEQNLLAQQAALERADWTLAQKRQSAQQAALVTDTLYRAGDWVPAGNPVVALLPPANLKVRAFVPQETIGRVQVGGAAQVVVDGLPEPFPANVSFVSPRAEFTPPVIYSQKMREKFVFLIELSVVPDVAVKLHPGQPVDVVLSL